MNATHRTPPALRFLLPIVLKLSLPPILVYTICRRWLDPMWTPTALLLFACVLSIPATVIIYVEYFELKREGEARKHGATLPKGIEPWGLALLKKIHHDVDVSTNYTSKVDWLGEYGPISSWRICFVDTVIVTEPEYLKRILVTETKSFDKGLDLISPLSQILGSGIFTSDGALWRFHRKMARPFFNRERISEFPLFEQRANTVIALITSQSLRDAPVDWQELMYRFTLDCATAFLFGHDSRSLFEDDTDLTSSMQRDHGKLESFSHSLQKGLILTGKRVRYGRAWPLLELREDKLRKYNAVIDAFLEPIINEHLRRKAESAGSNTECIDNEIFLEYLTRCTDDVKLIKDEAMTMLLGARDTIASTLTSAVFNLTKYPNICQKLHQEVVDVIGDRQPSYDDIRQMRYLRAFINEVLRLFPPVPMNVRSSRTGVVWPSTVPGEKPIYIPPNTRIVMPYFVTHRRDDLWGPDAAQFDPDRFLDARLNKYLTPNPMIFIPFNAGPRICLGQQFAYNATSFMIVRLLQHFTDFKLVNTEGGPLGPGSVKFRSHITLYASDGLWVKMSKEQQATS
ncbi:hypothetical protein PHLGIDRAFT_129485 [Phlebiopsis gigantea 11061_1 CR5-6]|uniref:Cytochrome P450 n=1 Tax=Phlebiopsis gigantea (strain 11061_1 CR5-6) TaxID=745531 RepID=A0A0C3S731_PHLG1|nr:hypothetical protein PHLGIDRAFT_129485 [Phlebiopsis gigantea 11061_1 CR5-6]